MADIYAANVALAARFAPGQVTPPAGFTNVRRSTAEPPQQITTMPMVVVFPDLGDVTLSRNGTRLMQTTSLVRFYYKLGGDLAREAVALQKWTGVLIDQLKLSVQFAGSVTGVAAVRVASFRIGYLPYGGKEYAGIELAVPMTWTEPWAAVA
jgi:hypothetical protein